MPTRHQMGVLMIEATSKSERRDAHQSMIGQIGQVDKPKAYHHECDVSIDALALDGVLHGHHSCLCALRVLCEGALHLSCSYSVAAHIDHIINPPCIQHGQSDYCRTAADTTRLDSG